MSLSAANILSSYLGIWDILTADQRDSLIRHTRIVEHPQGAHMHGAGAQCGGVIIVVSGSLRAYVVSPKTGREVTLFTVNGGTSCVLSASCILPMITFDIMVDTMEDSVLAVIDSAAFERVMNENVSVEAYVYRHTAERLSDVMWIMQQVMFMSVDERLAVYLLDEAARTGSAVLSVTHDEIARQVGSAREVVSRMLKRFEQDGVVELSRGSVKIVDRDRLRRLTSDL